MREQISYLSIEAKAKAKGRDVIELGIYREAVACLHDRLFPDSIYAVGGPLDKISEACSWWRAVVLAINADNEVVGFGALVLSQGYDAYLSDSFVLVEYRRLGIYKELLRRRMEIAKRLGATTVHMIADSKGNHIQYLIAEGFSSKAVDPEGEELELRKWL